MNKGKLEMDIEMLGDTAGCDGMAGLPQVGDEPVLIEYQNLHDCGPTAPPSLARAERRARQ